MKKIVRFLIIVGVFFCVYLILSEFVNKEKKLEQVIQTSSFYAMYPTLPVEYDNDAFIAYEEIEKYLKSYGLMDLEENIFSLVYKDTHFVYKLKDDVIVDEVGNVISTYKIENGKILVQVKPFLSNFGIKIMDKSSLQEEQIVEIEDMEEKTDIDLGLFTRREGIYFCAWDGHGEDPKKEFYKNLDVLMPSWISLKNSEGGINSVFNKTYYENAKFQKKSIWVLVTNSFDPDLTSEVLNSYRARMNMLEYLVEYVLVNRIDGINIDFENMYLKDSDAFVQFIAELNSRLVQHDKLLSVCVTVPGGSENWSLVYDRNRIAQNCDYLTLMAYDQHWENSQVPGPVASYSWVKKHLDDMITQIPPDKIILGVPFYTRIWYESFSKEVPNKIKVKSRSVYMETPQNLLNSSKNITKVWDDDAQQMFYVYFDVEKNEMVKFWYDDEDAVAKKASLVKEKSLAGIAAWRIGYEKMQVWDIINEVLH